MDKIIRCITSDGAIMAACVDASDIVFTAKKIHHLSRSATAALGRLLCATSIMGDMLKQKDASVNLRVMGDGELGPVIAVGDSSGNVKGYVGNADCPTEYYENGKINGMGSIIRVDSSVDISAEKGRCWSYTYCRKQSDACIDGHIYRMV